MLGQHGGAVDRVVSDKASVRLSKSEAHGVLVVHSYALHAGQHRAREGVTGLGILDALDVPLDRFGIDGLAIVILRAAPELERPGRGPGRLPLGGEPRIQLLVRVPAGEVVEDVEGERFTIDNPNASKTCGCGTSFDVAD